MMRFVDQRESPSNCLVRARHADEGFQEADNALPLLWAVLAQDGAAVHPGSFDGNLDLAHAPKAVWVDLYWATCRRPCEGIVHELFRIASPESACSCPNNYSRYIVFKPE